MYAIKLELKLNNKEKTLMAQPDTPDLCIIMALIWLMEPKE